MKKLLIITCLLISVSAAAQVVERTDVSVTVEGLPTIIIECVDADKLLDENSRKRTNEFAVPDAKIQISSNKVTDTVYSDDNGSTISTKAFRSTKLHFTVSKEGYETLEQDFKVSGTSVYLYIYLKKKK